MLSINSSFLRCIILSTCILLVASNVVLVCPTGRTAEDDLTSSPCGDVERSSYKTILVANSTICVQWRETVHSDGEHFELSLSIKGDKGKFTLLEAAYDVSNESDLNSTTTRYKNKRDTTGFYGAVIRVPDIICSDCVLQLKQITDDETYYSCADVVVVSQVQPGGAKYSCIYDASSSKHNQCHFIKESSPYISLDVALGLGITLAVLFGLFCCTAICIRICVNHSTDASWSFSLSRQGLAGSIELLLKLFAMEIGMASFGTLTTDKQGDADDYMLESPSDIRIATIVLLGMAGVVSWGHVADRMLSKDCLQLLVGFPLAIANWAIAAALLAGVPISSPIEAYHTDPTFFAVVFCGLMTVGGIARICYVISNGNEDYQALHPQVLMVVAIVDVVLYTVALILLCVDGVHADT